MKIWVEFGSNQDENVENEKVCKKRKKISNRKIKTTAINLD